MFKWDRVIVAILLVPTLLFVYVGEGFFHIDLKALPILIFTNLVVGIGTYEFYSMIKKSGREVYDKFGIIIALLIPNTIYLKYYIFPFFEDKTLKILILSALLMFLHRIFTNKIQGTLEKISLTLLGIIYVSVFFSQILLIYAIDPAEILILQVLVYVSVFFSQIINLYFIGAIFPFVLQVLVWISDTAAGIVGVAIGRKFFKNGFTEISPKKSVEGALGSLFFTGLAFSLIFYFISRVYPIEMISISSIIFTFIFGVIVSFVAQIGDLIESLFKRECGVKDSGKILLGHGGILDRFDSMIIVVPCYVLVMKLFV